jgi:hypothetical protein
MKTHALRNLHLVTGKVSLAVAWLLVLTVSFFSPAHAQETWRLDPQLSIARLSLGSGSNALETGLARVSGDVVFDSQFRGPDWGGRGLLRLPAGHDPRPQSRDHNPEP